MYVSPGGDLVELPQEGERFATREDAMQRAVEARDAEQTRDDHEGWIVGIDAEEVE